MAKAITSQFKIQAAGGKATPAPPIGPALGQHGVNPGQFIQQFNERTKQLNGKLVGCVITVYADGKLVGCVITVYADRSFEFEVKSPPAAVLILEAAGIEKGSGVPHKEKVGSISWEQCLSIAQEKGKELTGHTDEANARIIAGTARSMGVDVNGIPA